MQEKTETESFTVAENAMDVDSSHWLKTGPVQHSQLLFMSVFLPSALHNSDSDLPHDSLVYAMGQYSRSMLFFSAVPSTAHHTNLPPPSTYQDK
jgi:hypothetical protein